MYDNIKIIDGDISFDSVGKLVLSSGEDAIVQVINHKLNTVKGQLFYNLNYGIDKTKLDNAKKNSKYLNLVQGIINNALLDDKRIVSAFISGVANDKNGNPVLTLKISLSNNAVINIKYTT